MTSTGFEGLGKGLHESVGVYKAGFLHWLQSGLGGFHELEGVRDFGFRGLFHVWFGGSLHLVGLASL